MPYKIPQFSSQAKKVKSGRNVRASWMSRYCPEPVGLPKGERKKILRLHRDTVVDSIGQTRVLKSCLCHAWVKSGKGQRKCRNRALSFSMFCAIHRNVKVRNHASKKNVPYYDKSAGEDMYDPRAAGFYGCGCSYGDV